MKKILALVLCIVFVLLACASCNVGEMPDEKSSGNTTVDPAVLKSNRDLTKIFFPKYNDAIGGCVQNEEDFHEYLDSYIMMQESQRCDFLHINIVYEKESVLTDEELANIKYSDLVRYQSDKLRPYAHEKMMITIRIPFEDIDREEIMNLTENKKIVSIHFERIYTDLIVPA